MAREILFRGFSEESREWVYGDLINGLNAFLIGYYVDVPPTCNEPGGDIKRIHDEVIPESIGQFTGLTDKNGVKIFEGDVFQHPVCKKSFVVIYDDLSLGFKAQYEDDDVTSIPMQIDQERGAAVLVGNIFENPELVGV